MMFSVRASSFFLDALASEKSSLPCSLLPRQEERRRLLSERKLGYTTTT
jgi:hypothetical protein